MSLFKVCHSISKKVQMLSCKKNKENHKSIDSFLSLFMHKHLLDLSYWVLNLLLFLIMFIVYLDFSVREVKKLMKQSCVFNHSKQTY